MMPLRSQAQNLATTSNPYPALSVQQVRFLSYLSIPPDSPAPKKPPMVNPTQIKRDFSQRVASLLGRLTFQNFSGQVSSRSVTRRQREQTIGLDFSLPLQM